MSTLMKALLALAVALPLGAYVTGTLVASGDEPPPRDPVIIEENTPPTHQPTRENEPSGTPAGSDDDDDDHEGRGDDDDHDEIDVITPSPGDVDDDDDDDNSGPGGGDDDSGHGGGDDD